MVSTILNAYCLNQVIQIFLWSYNSMIITIYFIVWHHTCSSSMALRNGYIGRMLLFSVDIIKDKLPSCWIVLWVYKTGPLRRAKDCVYSIIMWKGNITLTPFSCFKRKRLLKMNLMHGKTDKISYVPTLVTWYRYASLTLHGSQNNITQHFS